MACPCVQQTASVILQKRHDSCFAHCLSMSERCVRRAGGGQSGAQDTREGRCCCHTAGYDATATTVTAAASATADGHSYAPAAAAGTLQALPLGNLPL